MKWRDLSKKKKAYLLAFAGFVGILLWAFISAGVITHNFNRSQLSTDQDRQEALINGIILTETKDDKKYWEIYGETGTYDSTNGVALLDNCIGNFYDDNNEVTMSFESSKGTYNSKKTQIIMYNDTRIVIKDGIMLEADRLTWTGRENPVIAKGNVKITRNGQFIATANEVEISPEYDKFKITGNAVSKMYDPKEK
ncbi:LPS export ABC transporter periplasmic protein LptC [Spirochaetes bacterium]|uniref:LPS export ABC transporter periplasmic protein LptC n=1 Tax=Candidatus Scatousia excrementipullorum TaxID=2840936 RepID=A0A9D9GYS4_9BACT|nr:LPS export ABC transporter periplasmic protein LptC [Candidatus Scatousia excrementipullorum]